MHTNYRPLDGRKKIVSDKKLCCNCTGTSHRAAKCRSSGTCYSCKGEHHSSICDKTSVRFMASSGTKLKEVVHPAVIVEFEGIKCRIRADLVRSEDLGFPQLVEALWKWTEKNPVADDGGVNGGAADKQAKRDRQMNTKSKGLRQKKCVYCGSAEH